MRCLNNESQYYKIKQIVEKGEFESISNVGSTRYGTSMRGSSLDSRGAGQYRNSAYKNSPAISGSDGFGKFKN